MYFNIITYIEKYLVITDIDNLAEKGIIKRPYLKNI